MNPEDEANDGKPQLAGDAARRRRRSSAFIAILMIVGAIALLVVIFLLHATGIMGRGSH
jgi:type VI protein secretion system component VasF